jgi:hypothetical protein
MTSNTPPGLGGFRVGRRVAFDWFGKHRAGHITAIDGRMCDVRSDLHGKTYVVDMNDLRPNPLLSSDEGTES